MEENLRVVDITKGRQWTTARLTREAGVELAYKIATFPMGAATSEDRWIWWPHPRGTPTVKAIYYSLLPQSDHHWEGWRNLWRLPVAPRIRVFCWKLLWGRLPTSAYLHYIHVGAEERCAMCGLFPEMIDHLMFTCRYSREVWEILRSSEEVETALINQDWITREWCTTKENDRRIKGKIACTLWALWKCRNEVVFGGKRMAELAVVRSAVAMAEEYGLKTKEKTVKTRRRKRWEPPDPGWTKANTDGSFKPDAYQGGAATILRNAEGELVQAAWEPCPGNSALQTELWAIRMALQMASKESNLVIKTDCSEAIRCMQQVDHCPWRVRNLAQECAEIAKEFVEVRLAHVGREANAVADWAAAKARVASGYCYAERLSQVPSELCNLLTVDAATSRPSINI
ncbi:uncharacterized protein [Typha latifolia]|uniref:uncharacterized protein n=1 Tax=Typha latifolia TaxID=4733 RepID=UPI003C2C71E6